MNDLVISPYLNYYIRFFNVYKEIDLYYLFYIPTVRNFFKLIYLFIINYIKGERI